MTRGLSRAQLGLIAVYLLMLGLTFLTVLLGQWRLAAAAGVVSFGLFSGLVVLTLARMTYSQRVMRERVTEIRREVRGSRMARTLRRLDERHQQLTRGMDRVEGRLQFAEQRMVESFEDHRLHVEDELSRLGGHSADEVSEPAFFAFEDSKGERPES